MCLVVLKLSRICILITYSFFIYFFLLFIGIVYCFNDFLVCSFWMCALSRLRGSSLSSLRVLNTRQTTALHHFFSIAVGTENTLNAYPSTKVFKKKIIKHVGNSKETKKKLCNCSTMLKQQLCLSALKSWLVAEHAIK